MPALRTERGAQYIDGTICALRRERKATRLAAGHLYFADRHIQMPALVAGNGADVCAINHHHGLLIRQGLASWLGIGRSFNLGGDPVGPIAHRRMVGGRAWQERRQQPPGFPERVPSAELSLDPAELGRATVAKQIRK